MIAFGARAPSQFLPANGGGGSKVATRAPVRTATAPAPVRGTVARPVSTFRVPTTAPRPAPTPAKNPFAGNPVFAPLVNRVMQKAGTTSVTPLRSPTPIMAPRPAPPVTKAPAPIAGTPVGGPPVRGTLLARPIPPPVTTGAPVSQSIPIQTYAGVPPAGTPPSMTFGPTQGVVTPDTLGLSVGGPEFSISGFQMTQTNVLLLLLVGGAVIYFMVTR